MAELQFQQLFPTFRRFGLHALSAHPGLLSCEEQEKWREFQIAPTSEDERALVVVARKKATRKYEQNVEMLVLRPAIAMHWMKRSALRITTDGEKAAATPKMMNSAVDQVYDGKRPWLKS